MKKTTKKISAAALALIMGATAFTELLRTSPRVMNQWLTKMFS